MSPMGQYQEEVAVLGFQVCNSLAAAAPLTLPAHVDVSAYSRIMVIAMCDSLSFGSTLTTLVREATSAAGAGAATVATCAVRNSGPAQDVVGYCEVFEDQLTQGAYFANYSITHDDASGSKDLSGILLGGFPREKPVDAWTPGYSTTTTTTA